MERAYDWDLDGYDRPSLDGDDCDDQRADVHPGAEEDECDGVDEDCDGLIDEGVTVTYYRDADGDGFGVSEGAIAACEPPGEAWSFLSGDCDDSDELVHPDMDEICGDLVDNDCDGVAGSCSLDGEWTAGDFFVLPGDQDDRHGVVLAHGDWFAGPEEDLLVASSSGQFAVLAGPIERSTRLGDAWVDGRFPFGDDRSRYRAFAGANVGDLNADGVEDYAVSTIHDQQDPRLAVFVFYPPTGAAWSPTVFDDPSIYTNEIDVDELGFTISAAGDVNSDGFGDIWLGTPESDIAALLYYGPVDVGVDALESAAVVLMGEEEVLDAGWSLEGANDLNGDGTPDLLVTAVSGAGGRGRLYLLEGPVDGGGHVADGNTLDAPLDFGFAGLSTALGDVDGDGAVDLLVGAIDVAVNAEFAGGAYVLSGPLIGERWEDVEFATFSGDTGDDRWGWSASLGDLDGDDRADVVLGAPFRERGNYGQDVGLTTVFLDLQPGAYAIDDADSFFWGDSDNDVAGVSVLVSPDLTGDGLSDVVIGAPNDQYGGVNAGAAYLIPFTSL